MAPMRLRMLLCLCAVAILLLVTVVAITLLGLQPKPSTPTPYVSIRHVPIAHFQKAMNDIVQRQDELCNQLKQLQVCRVTL